MALNSSIPSQSLSCKGPISLPPEIIKLVADRLQDDRQALHACLLVSRAWSQAAVEYLYKAEHMMADRDSKPFSVSGVTLLSLEGLSLEDKRPGVIDMRSEFLLKRTFESSLLHDTTCTYDYISYINKVSCPWLVSLIQDWSEFCEDWRGRQSNAVVSEEDLGLLIETEPSTARQEHCFNRLVRKLSKRCITVDEFQSSSMVQPETLIYSIRHFKNLTWMDLSDSQDLDDDVFRALSSTVHSLSYVRLPGLKMKNVSTKAVADMILAQTKDSLKQFKVNHGTNIFGDDSVLEALGEQHGRSMQRLTLSICDLEHSGLKEHGLLFAELVSLNLEYASGVTDDVILPILDACRRLMKLDLTETDCTHAVIHGLSTASDTVTPQPGRFTEMKRLILNNIDAPFTTNLFLPLADACPNLEELHMNSILADSFQDFDQFISKTKRLRDLDIGNVFPEFSDANLARLVDALPSLRWLSIANTQITNESLIYLAENANDLCDLCILGCDQVTKAGLIEFLDKIANKAEFRRLDITYCRLDEGAVSDIRDRAKANAMEHGSMEPIEVEGDDQFVDSLEEAEREDGEDQGEDEDEEESEGFDISGDEEFTEDATDSTSHGLPLEDGHDSDTLEDLDSEEEFMSDYSDTLSDLEENEDGGDLMNSDA
ncbi:hypothetical protein BGX21_009371 [Mortierella sp. AD011]|nr:hypothetical protein BGX20_002169 [Mortierella sp. AD010]KAF9402625.1 hypothetical protein BGX21_009371 [Mortierella sp. AD011]